MHITCVYTSFYGYICDSVRLLRHVTSDVIRTIVVRRRPNRMLNYVITQYVKSLLYKYCGAIRIICRTVIPPLPPSPPSSLSPSFPLSLSLPPSFPSPPLPSLPFPSLPPSLPLVTQRIHCPFQPKQNPSIINFIIVDFYTLLNKMLNIAFLNKTKNGNIIISDFEVHSRKIWNPYFNYYSFWCSLF